MFVITLRSVNVTWHLPLRWSHSSFFWWMSSRRTTCKYRLSMYYYVKILCYNLMKAMQYQHRWKWKDLHKKWKNGPEWYCPIIICGVFTIRNGGMMCRSSCIVDLIACRVIRVVRVTRRNFVGWCRVSVWRGKEIGGFRKARWCGIEKPFAFTVGVFPIWGVEDGGIAAGESSSGASQCLLAKMLLNRGLSHSSGY